MNSLLRNHCCKRRDIRISDICHRWHQTLRYELSNEIWKLCQRRSLVKKDYFHHTKLPYGLQRLYSKYSTQDYFYGVFFKLWQSRVTIHFQCMKKRHSAKIIILHYKEKKESKPLQFLKLFNNKKKLVFLSGKKYWNWILDNMHLFTP